MTKPTTTTPKRKKVWLTSWLLYVVYKILRLTWKVEISFDELATRQLAAVGAPTAVGTPTTAPSGRKSAGPYAVVAHFHEDEWALLPSFEGQKMHVLVSLSEDGSLMASFLEKIGYVVTRGSSSRGAIAGLLGLLRSIRRSPSKLVSIAVDGPKGPRRRVKNGIFKIAESLDAQLIVIGAHADRAWVFKKSWSKAFIPKPFARVHLHGLAFQTPEFVKKMVERDDLAELSAQVEDKIRAAKVIATDLVKSLAKT